MGALVFIVISVHASRQGFTMKVAMRLRVATGSLHMGY